MIFRTESELPENSVQYILVTTIITRYCTVVDRMMHGVLEQVFVQKPIRDIKYLDLPVSKTICIFLLGPLREDYF